MTNFRKIALASAALATVGVAGTAHAAQADAQAFAKIVTAITMTKTQDLDFGTIVVGTAAQDVTLTPAGGISCGALTCTGTPKAAWFSVTGTVGSNVLTTLPADNAVTLTAGSNSMPLKAFTTNWGTGAHALTAADVLRVGATLTVGANQPEGNYQGTFQVQVNYQ